MKLYGYGYVERKALNSMESYVELSVIENIESVSANNTLRINVSFPA